MGGVGNQNFTKADIGDSYMHELQYDQRPCKIIDASFLLPAPTPFPGFSVPAGFLMGLIAYEIIDFAHPLDKG